MGIYKKFVKSTYKRNKGLIHLDLDDSDLCSPDEQVRLKAISQIEDDDLLLDFAQNDPVIEVRISAVELIANEDILKDIAYNNSNSRLRVAAISNTGLKKEKVFIDLARDSNKDVRIASINRINDVDVLWDIAHEESNRQVKQVALEKIKE